MIPFTKAHACGNDFLIVNSDDARNFDQALLTQRLCERNTGIGADGVEFFEWTGDNSGRIRLHNSDGSLAEISGNGTRCVAAWMADHSSLEPELFVERIPFKETRDYVKKVLATEAVYRALDGKPLTLEMPTEIPPRPAHLTDFPVDE